MKRLKDQSPNLNPCFTAVTPNTSPVARDTYCYPELQNRRVTAKIVQ